jgi:hypothetical protein
MRTILVFEGEELELTYPVPCPECDGHATVGPARSAEGDWLDQPCPHCGGSGHLRTNER